MDEEKTHEDGPQEGEGPVPGPVDPLTERLEFKALALEHARRALRPSAVFGTSAPVDAEDLIFVADWLLDEMPEGDATSDLSLVLPSSLFDEDDSDDS